jgi:peptidoglycan/xylan/chitin deacetylase (PgdA/CDA1 family)
MRKGESRNQKYICITFDDAYEGLYHHAWPILKEYGFSATIFVVTDYVGRDNDWDVNWGGRKFKHLRWEQIKEMSTGGIEFGSHTCSHQDVRYLNERELEKELLESKFALENNLGKKIQTLSYPFGRYNQRVKDTAEKCGYIFACSLSPAMKNSQIDFLALRRCAVYITDNISGFENKIFQEKSGFWLQDLWCRIVNFCAGGTIMVKRAGKIMFKIK